MATQYLDEEEYQLQQQQQPGIGSGGASSAAPVSGSGVAPPKATDTSGKFVNFGSYIGANRDAAAQRAQALSGRIGAEADRTQGAFNDHMNQVNKDIAASGVQNDHATLSPPSTYNYDPEGGNIGSVQQGLTASQGPSIDYGTAQTRANTYYTGPSGADDSAYYPQWTDMTARIDKSGDKVRASRSAEGIGEMSGGRSQHEKNFDGALMGQAGGDAWKNLRHKFEGMVGGFNSSIKGSHDTSDARSAESDKLRQGYADQVGAYDRVTTHNKESWDANQAAATSKEAERQLKIQEIQGKMKEARKSRQFKNIWGYGLGIPMPGQNTGHSPEEDDYQRQLDELGYGTY